MDYSHSPFLIVLVGAVGVLTGVLVVGAAFFMFRRPTGRPGPPGGPPPGSGPNRPD